MKYKIKEYVVYYWTIWAKALGEKAFYTNSSQQWHANRFADKVAIVRTCIVLLYIITNCFIIAGVIRHW